jgi:hypothetical protein
MTTYAERELSRQGSEPIELYRFTRFIPPTYAGDAPPPPETWTYANADIAVTYDAEIYTPLPGIHRGDIQQNGEEMSMTVEVDIPIRVGGCITDEFVGTSSPFPIRMQIIRWQRGLADAEVVMLFNGEVSGSYFEESAAHLSGTSEEAAWGNALGRTYCQRTCPHMLYDSFCRADLDAVQKLFFAIIINEDRLTLQVREWPDTDITGYIAAGSQMLVGGMVRAFSQSFLIVKQVDDVLTLQTTLPAAVLFDTHGSDTPLTISPGCNRQVTDCDSVFHNLERFGGFPLLPERSPWEGLR